MEDNKSGKSQVILPICMYSLNKYKLTNVTVADQTVTLDIIFISKHASAYRISYFRSHFDLI